MADSNMATKGGGFLIANVEPSQIFTPETFTEEQVMIGRTARDFVDNEVRPRLKQMEAREHKVTVELLRKAGGLGLLGIDVPEAYGGADLDKATSTYVTEIMSRGASFAISFGAHTGIGTLPIVFFGNEEQKKRYLPSLASGEKLAAYALTEPDAGSDAQGIKTTAHLSKDGRHYLLKGEKQWITNSGFADIFVVYAKVDGDKMTAFIVERNTPGLSVGPEFDKMGLHASSTCSVHFSDSPVPKENVLGEIGRGHIIAFNILNIGRWKLAAGCLGSCKAILEVSAKYAKERRQFGKAIAQFPAIQQKLAQMSARTFALESVAYRTAGLFDKALATMKDGDAAKAIGEYAVEASVNKVFGSEALDFVVDEGVQIHGGYGYMREFEVERAYRDARINRIFEGTNEVNRLLIPATLMRRALKGDLPLLQAVQQAQAEATSGKLDAPPSAVGGQLEAESALLANAKRAALLIAGLGVQKYMTQLEQEQELLLAVADLVIDAYALESALLRAGRMATQLGQEKAAGALDMARLFAEEVADQSEQTARRALAGISEGDELQMHISLLRRLFRRTPANRVTLGRRIAQRVLEVGGYTV